MAPCRGARHLTASPHEDVCRWSTAQRMRRFLDDALPLAKEAVGSALVALPSSPKRSGCWPRSPAPV
jgi:hypothetical protein